MKLLCPIYLLLILLYSCDEAGRVEKEVKERTNFLHDIVPFTSDSLIKVVIEIPAGTNQKWEVNKTSGQIEWEQVSRDSFRVVNNLPYPSNYGFVPQTLLAEATGGDGDPVDVFVLGAAVGRGAVLKVRMVGLIHMLDNGESDSKLLAVNSEDSYFGVSSLEMLNLSYPGVIDILKLWLMHYKGPGEVDILSVGDEVDAIHYFNTAHETYLQQKIK